MRGACRNVALTCGFAIFAGPPAIDNIDGDDDDPSISGCSEAEKYDRTNQTGQYNDGIINCVSEMFYESLLCPDNAQYKTEKQCEEEGSSCVYYGEENTLFVNARCQCLPGYEPYGTLCVAECGENAARNSYGTCTCKTGYTGTHCDACASGYSPSTKQIDGKAVAVCVKETTESSQGTSLPNTPTECEANGGTWTDGTGCSCPDGKNQSGDRCV